MSDQEQAFAHTTSGFPISVANICIRIKAGDARYSAFVRNRYRNFFRNQETNFRLVLEQTSLPIHTSLMDAEMRSEYKHVEFLDEHGQARGVIDFQDRKARLFTQPRTAANDIEYVLRVIYAYLLFEAGGLLFHAAGIECEGYADLFFGKSGIGKTTLARASANCRVLNDDLVAIVPENAQWIVCGTPFWNPTQVAPLHNCAPLGGLFRLVQDSDVYLEQMSNAVALGEVIANVPIISGDPSCSEALLARCQELLETVPIQALHFLPDDTFWPVVLEDRALRLNQLANPG